jgi:hypothetical protein
VAENLGVAQLSLDVDLKGLEAGLQKAKQQIERFSVQGIKLDFGSADQQFRRLEASAKVFEAQLRKLSTTPLNLNASGLGKLGADAQKAGADLSAFTRGVINGDRALANNIAGLQQQGAAFRTLAANVKIGTAEFRNFTQAAAQAGQKQLFAGFEEIKSLESLFKLGGSGGQSSFKGTEQLLAFSSKIGSTPAAINLYVQALKQAQSLTSTTDANFAKLTAEISRQRQALEQAAAAAERYGKSLKAPQLALPPGRGPSQFTFTGPTAEDLAAEERNRRRQAKIGSRVDYFSTGGRSTPDAGFVAKPNLAAIEAERRLGKERQKTAAESLKASKAEAQQRQAAAKRSKDVLSNALIGGAFPALFGQGAGASIGGALGGGIGGAIGGQFGFGLSLIGTALGQAFDNLNLRFAEVATALQDPIASFDVLKEKSILASKAQETYIQALIDTGRTAEATLALRNEAAKTVDPTNALLLVASTDELNRAWSDLQDRLGGFTSGPAQVFASWLAQVIKLAGGVPGGREPLTGRRAVQNAQNQQATGFTLGSLGLALGIGAATFATGGLALAGVGAGAAVAGLGFGSGISGKDKERVANSEAVAQKEAEINALLTRQAGTQNAIVQAQRLGLTVAAEAFKVSAQIQAVNIAAAERELQIQAALAAGKLTQAQAEENLNQSAAARKTQLDAIVAQEQAAALAAQQSLAVAQVLVGARGAEKQILQEQLNIAKAQYEAEQARAALATRQKDPTASVEELDALEARAEAAGAKLKEAMLSGASAVEQALESSADKVKQAADQLKDAKANVDRAIDALQSSSEGSFKFLTRDVKDQVLGRARQDIQAGVDAGRIDPKFLNARSPSKVFEAAAASRSQLDALASIGKAQDALGQAGENFLKAQEEYTSALDAASTNMSKVFGDSTTALGTKFDTLAERIEKLAGKDWTVNVTVEGNSAANVRVE